MEVSNFVCLKTISPDSAFWQFAFEVFEMCSRKFETIELANPHIENAQTGRILRPMWPLPLAAVPIYVSHERVLT
ncbi:unnamed protein product [Litomosoides sigmodontis]|uniref:Uncharacterized protein n=1 Tax=Litomosoides sigmodontis TaxID=42156 RepID=A0A3P6UDA4_LITSI|nr:unnamed protein product [Litomosoides sigmodontis]